MTNLLTIPFMSFYLVACSQSHDIYGEYEIIGPVQFLLKSNLDSTFYFDSYNKVNSGLPAEPSISGKETWRAENGVIYFETNPDTDIDHNYTLNFNETKAKFII